MKVTIEFTTDDDLDMLESVFKARAAEAVLTGGRPLGFDTPPAVNPCEFGNSQTAPSAPAFAPPPPDMFGAPAAQAPADRERQPPTVLVIAA